MLIICYLVGRVVLRIYVTLDLFQSYRDLEAGDIGYIRPKRWLFFTDVETESI